LHLEPTIYSGPCQAAPAALQTFWIEGYSHITPSRILSTAARGSHTGHNE